MRQFGAKAQLNEMQWSAKQWCLLNQSRQDAQTNIKVMLTQASQMCYNGVTGRHRTHDFYAVTGFPVFVIFVEG